MRGASIKVGECKTPISLLLAHASTALQLVVILVMFNVFSLSAIAQSTVGTRDSEVQQVPHATMSPSSPWDSPPEDLKLSYSVRRFARSAGLPPNTMFHVCWDFNFFLMLGLIYWKCGPLLTTVLQARSRSIQSAIEEAQRPRRRIDHAAQRARHQLQAFAADLAISLARESIQIDKRTDEQLVQNFIQELGHEELALTTVHPPTESNRELVTASMPL